MRKITKLCAAFAALLWAGLFASCSVDAIEEVNVNGTKAVTVNAGIETADTRVVLAEEGTKLKTYWKDAAGSEEFSLFCRAGGGLYLKFVKSNETTNAAGAAFTCSSAPASIKAGAELYAAYPYVNKTEGNDFLDIDIKNQTGLLTSSDPAVKTVNDFNYMVAESTVPADGDLSKASFNFKNLVTILKLSLTFPSDAGTTISSAYIVRMYNNMVVAYRYGLPTGRKESEVEGVISINSDITLSSDKKADLYVALLPQNIGSLKIRAQIGPNVYTATININKKLETTKMYHASATMTKDFNMYEWYTNNTSATEFTISNAYEMLAFANLVNGTDKANSGQTSNLDFAGKTVKLATFIDLGAVCGAGNNWNPIGLDPAKPFTTNFKGTFDGNGYIIRNLYINNPTESRQGLFGNLGAGAVVKKLTLGNSTIIGDDYVGGIAGHSEGATGNTAVIEKCRVDMCNITANGTFTASAGGILGGSDGYTDIVGCTCYFGKVTGAAKSVVGGIAGAMASNSTLVGCKTSKGEIKGGANAYIGGILGQSQKNARLEVKACLSTTTLTLSSGSGYRGGIVGNNLASNTIAGSAYYVNYDSYSGTGANIGTDNSISLGTTAPTDWTNVSGGIGNVITALNTAWGSTLYEFKPDTEPYEPYISYK